MQESQTPQGSGVGRVSLPTSRPAVQRHGHNARDGGLADAAMPREDVAVRDAVLRERIQQRARDVVLAGNVGKALRTVFPGQNLITHAEPAPPARRSSPAASRRLYRSGLGGRGTFQCSHSLSTISVDWARANPRAESIDYGIGEESVRQFRLNEVWESC